ncbi:ABC transporter ATP-binding protein [Nocardia puris]|uniref:NitT/TauT family transport system ATP-binding protein/sulfonate transport system ATP-binding protein n=1 Tax=Nocardia puris TaxID=208602 RepID=A0A366DXX1_9NOCA|nr:ABC transporter ATP-binding protein [Nocardia puris]MBF6209892.1 ABC transporter ATP-binding protein [Nocardia puris]MBF6366464.1 ABC transporter ATP-binding protein [Nocardia puris]MBF6458197.1 ABC transporter ATP-binding protein [Nocardia puris]RBO94369.1 NitT/TauT family transport system ATP-binding protein/sulfonate transport system ATP-binding protein [Nocardia puris]
MTTATRLGAPLTLAGLTKSFPSEQGPVTAVADLDLAIEAGEFIAVVGASGCGKSTLLRMLAGFEAPTSGVLEVGGAPVAGPGPDRGVVFQDYGLFPWLTVLENVAYGPRQNGASRAEARKRAERFIELVGLTRVAARFPNQLSGGMQQRVAIARVLCNEPAVMLMDEPFGALDALTRGAMQRELGKIHRDLGTTTVFVTHSVEEAVYLADRVVVMSGGISHGIPGHIEAIVDIGIEHPRDVNSAEFGEQRRRISALIEGH